MEKGSRKGNRAEPRRAQLGTRTIQERGPANAGPLQRSSEKTPQNTLNSTLPITVKRAEARAPAHRSSGGHRPPLQAAWRNPRGNFLFLPGVDRLHTGSDVISLITRRQNESVMEGYGRIQTIHGWRLASCFLGFGIKPSPRKRFRLSKRKHETFEIPKQCI